jgi:rod shape-determining protein MreC
MLGTLDRTPPPFFRQGPSALTKLAFFSALALFLMAADTRLNMTHPLRSALSTTLLPVQRALRVPLEMAEGGRAYLQGLKSALEGQQKAQAQVAGMAARVAQVDQLAAENAQLRALLDLRPALVVRSTAAEVLFEAADPYSRKVYIDRGSQHNIQRGAPVLNEAGVVGQVTRVYPLSSEVTLLIDKDAAIPVLNPRTQQRSAAFGGAEAGLMELRFMAGNSDVQEGDALVTSGIDGVYPPGLAVARIAKVDRRNDSGFARILLQPAANADGVRHVLVLEPLGVQMPPRPEPSPEPDRRGRPDAKKGDKVGGRR